MVTPAPCGQGCGAVMEELVYEFGLLYDLKPDDEGNTH